MSIIGSEVWPTSTPKNAHERIITGVTKETFHGSFRLDNIARKTIDQIDSGEKSFIPILKRHRCICKKR
jgi:hypothetical protein